MTIADNIARIREQIHHAEKEYARLPNSVTLLAVSKSQSIDQITQAVAAGQRVFGENYLQEAIPKILALRALNLEWHFIGAIQANKTRGIAEHFSWVHSLCDVKIAKRLHAQRPITLPPLNVCLQVNIDQSPTKSGILLPKLYDAASAVRECDRLRLRGLMTVPDYSNDLAITATNFQKLKVAEQQLIAKGFLLDTLSMGMTHDFVEAIKAGSTIVRIGAGIFGVRP